MDSLQSTSGACSLGAISALCKGMSMAVLMWHQSVPLKRCNTIESFRRFPLCGGRICNRCLQQMSYRDSRTCTCIMPWSVRVDVIHHACIYNGWMGVSFWVQGLLVDIFVCILEFCGLFAVILFLDDVGWMCDIRMRTRTQSLYIEQRRQETERRDCSRT